jgi:hypothetical protein
MNRAVRQKMSSRLFVDMATVLHLNLRCRPYFFSGNSVTSTKVLVLRYVFAAC